MELKLDLTREYGIVLEGGGAKGAYQIGAWKALLSLIHILNFTSAVISNRAMRSL